MLELVIVVIGIAAAFTAYQWISNLFDREQWREQQGPLTAAIRDALLEKDMTYLELHKWIKQNRPGLDAKYPLLYRATESWESTAFLEKYRKADESSNRELVYLRWLGDRTVNHDPAI